MFSVKKVDILLAIGVFINTGSIGHGRVTLSNSFALPWFLVVHMKDSFDSCALIRSITFDTKVVNVLCFRSVDTNLTTPLC